MQPGYPAGLVDHGLQDLLGVFVVQEVHLHIPLTHLHGELGVLVDEGVDTGAHHAQGHVGHHFDVDGDFQGRAAVELQGPLGDIDPLVADALEFSGDAHGGDGQPQIRGHRLPQRQEPEGLFLDLQLGIVQGVIGNHVPGQVGVAVGDGGQAFFHGGFGQCRHPEQILLRCSNSSSKCRIFLGESPSPSSSA